MKKKILIGILCLLSALTCALSVIACSDKTNESETSDNATTDDGGYTFETAYSTAKDLGYSGTLEDFIESIKGKDGTGIVSTILNNNGELVIVLSNGTVQNLGKIVGENGKDGKDGDDGNAGEKGDDGVGVADAYLDENGDLIIELTNGKEVNCGSTVYESERLLYSAIKEDGEITGYAVRGLGTVSDADLVIPSVYNGKPVIRIDRQAFNCSYVTSVSIPESVEIIDDETFKGCSGLESITVDENNKVYGSQDGILYNKEKTEIIFVPLSVKGKITLSDKLTTIGGFNARSNLVGITIHAEVTAIENSAFSLCSLLEEINFCGTHEQWKAISKGNNWNLYTGDFVVHCSDGVDLDKNGNVIE